MVIFHRYVSLPEGILKYLLYLSICIYLYLFISIYIYFSYLSYFSNLEASNVPTVAAVGLQGSVGAPGILPAGDGPQPGSQYCVFGDAPAVCRNDLLVPRPWRPSPGSLKKSDGPLRFYWLLIVKKLGELG